jgi:putative (di)nucleoside polyphosphate hydrolase
MKPNLDQHRPNAAVVLFNRQGQVLLCRRAGERGKTCWQFPQGGIDAGEKPLAAALRELEEETGVGQKQVVRLSKIKGWVPYDFPANVKFAPAKRKQWRGQKQKWFAFLFLGKDKDIRLDRHKPVEFDKWMWTDLSEAPDMTIKWKRDVYMKVAKHFKTIARVLKVTSKTK